VGGKRKVVQQELHIELTTWSEPEKAASGVVSGNGEVEEGLVEAAAARERSI
jgi:hypothetical protein